MTEMSVTMDKDNNNRNGVNGKYLTSIEKDINTNGNGPENEKQSNINGRKCGFISFIGRAPDLKCYFYWISK